MRALNARIVIHHLYISPGHNFFGRHGRAAGTHQAVDVPAITCRAGFGIEGDRFFDYRQSYKGQITFFDWKTYETAKRQFGVPTLEASAFRRNVLIAGADLNGLIGTTFSIGGVTFEGTEECRPCYWMDSVVAAGAEAWLRGQGGLRARILTDGDLLVGTHQLTTNSELMTAAGQC